LQELAMKVRIRSAQILTLLLVTSAFGGIEISPSGAGRVNGKIPELKLVAKADESWYSTEPVWQGVSGEISAKAWIATTVDELLFHIVVTDPEQKNDFHERSLWRGDSVLISIDARGDTPEKLNRQNAYYEPDDATYVFGLGTNGPEGRAVKHGQPARLAQEQTQLLKSIVRSERDKTTTYDVVIPWRQLYSAHGQSDTVGIAMTVAHRDSDGREIKWGRIRASGGQPRRLNKFALRFRKGDFATIAPKRLRLTEDAQQGEATVAVRAHKGAVISASVGQHSKTLKIAPAKNVQRYAVTVSQDLLDAQSDVLKISVTANGPGPAAESSFTLSNPSIVMQWLRARIEKLLKTSPNDIVTQHLNSTLMVARSVYNNLELERSWNPGEAEYFIDVVDMILGKLPKKRFDFDSHIRKALPFVFAFVSKRDHSLQFYSLQMPYNWARDRAYPLTVYLHGAVGNSSPLTGLSTCFDNSQQDTLFREVDIEADNVPASHRGFILAPWCRGNMYYKGIAEQDFRQAFEKVKKQFKIDERRQYITGFSMGCHGAWAIASRTPELWAGINLSSGFGGWSDTDLDYLVENVRAIPVILWIGELDGMYKNALKFDALLTSRGIDHKLVTAPNTPHTYPYLQYQQNVGYLMQFKRKKLNEFSFVADEQIHSGRNGVYMHVPHILNPDALPRFTCRLSPGRVEIDSKNTAGIRVELGEDGLGLNGPVEVIWNGKSIYKGEPKTVEAGKKIPRFRF